MVRAIALGVVIFLAGCAYPISHDEQGSAPGQLYFPEAQPDARVSIDGNDAGMAASYTGKQVLSVAPGTHRIVVTAQGRVVLDKKYYVGAGARVSVQ